ncbi:MAG: UDP-N-acetylmuramate dehydrogenase [Candidatus Aminicenantes bacterium]|nr:UDP-N-acetylmuramate dehydrogenase [Candidatus Aminicenantes bacterium]
MKEGTKKIDHLFLALVGRSLQTSVSLKEHSTFRIGGPADFFFEAYNLEELKQAVLFARDQKIPVYVIGGGSNILFADEGYRGLIIKNSSRGIKVFLESLEIEALSGTKLSELVDFAAQSGLSGLEFMAGIPGTVGGAVWGNAGAFGRNIGDILVSAYIWEAGEERKVKRDFFDFGYRSSSLKKRRSLLLSARFKVEKETSETVQKRVNDILSLRRLKHPPAGTASAGSFFKNIFMPDGQKIAAGLLLDQAGVKGLRCGDAQVYPRHANFIINLGQAKAADVLTLAAEMKGRVKEKFGLELEEEVIYLEANASML